MNAPDPQQSKPAVVYISLDCLLDTRLGTIARHNEELAVKVLSEGYLSRDMDSFEGLNQIQFARLYKERDVETLQRSVLTSVILVLKGIVKGSYDDLFNGGQNTGVEFVLNTHPYDLTDEEIDVMVKSISVKTFKSANVRAIRVSDEFLTPAYCKEHFTLMIMYNYAEWLMMHVKAFEETQMPGVGILAPALYQKIPTEGEFENMKSENLHPFRAAEMSVAPLFSLRLLDASVFSVHQGIKPGQPKPPELVPEKPTPKPEKVETPPQSSSSPSTGELDDELL